MHERVLVLHLLTSIRDPIPRNVNSPQLVPIMMADSCSLPGLSSLVRDGPMPAHDALCWILCRLRLCARSSVGG